MLVFYPLLSFLHELHDPHQSDSVDQVCQTVGGIDFISKISPSFFEY